MGAIYLRGNTFWIKYYRHGKPYRESAKSDKESEAKRLLKLREGQITEGKFPGLYAERTKWDDLKDDLVTDYKVNGRKSLVRLEISIAHLEKHFKGMRAHDITTGRINKYIEARFAGRGQERQPLTGNCRHSRECSPLGHKAHRPRSSRYRISRS